MAFSFLATDVFVMQFSLQFAPVLIITLLAMIWIAYHRTARLQSLSLTFFIVGSVTNYFDLITVPSIALGLPLLIVVVLHGDSSFKLGFRAIVILSLSFAIAYMLTWFTKWGLSTALTGQNIFTDAYGEASSWNENRTDYVSRAVSSCVSNTHWKYLVIVLIVLVLCICRYYSPNHWSKVMLLGCIALIPFAYYLVMPRPAFHHNWFNYRALMISIAALLMMATTLCDWSKDPSK